MRPRSGLSRLRGLLAGLVLLLGAGAPRAEATAVPRPAPVPCPRCDPVAAATQKAAPEPPDGTRGYDARRYDLELRIDPVAATVSGTVRMRLRAVEAPLDTVLLDLVSNVDCTAVRSADGDLLFTRSGDRLRVVLDEVLAPDRELELEIDWNGQPAAHGELRGGLIFRRHDAGTRRDPSDDQPSVFTISQPWSAHAWWPCKDNPADKALVSLAVTAPDSLRTVANGLPGPVSTPEPGWRRSTWRHGHPVATYLVGLAISDYESWSEECDGPGFDSPVALDYHVFPHDREDAAIDLARTCEMMRFMTDLAGPYPFADEKYGQVEVKWGGGAMENQTITAIPTFAIRGDEYFETLVLHELSHHWYGNSLTPRDWSDIWLNEGFARYCEALWVEHEYGREAYDEFLLELGRERHETLFAGEGTLDDPNPIIQLLVYDKGAYVLHMLRGLLGDGAFFGLLRDWAQDPARAYGSVSTSDFVALAESHAGRSLDGFFTPWLTTDAVPEIAAAWQTVPTGTSRGRVGVTLRQLQQTPFELPVPVAIHFRGGMSLQTARLVDPWQHFRFTVPGAVDSVVIDPRGLALLRSDTSPSPRLEVRGPLPNPVGSRAGVFRIFLTRPEPVTVQVYDARGRKLESIALGELAATGLLRDPLSVGHEFGWPAPRAAGPARYASGVYWLEFSTRDFRIVRKAVLVR